MLPEKASVYRFLSCLRTMDGTVYTEVFRVYSINFSRHACVDEKVKIHLCDLVLRLACYFGADVVDENPYSLCAASRLYLRRDSRICSDYDLYYCPVRIATREIKPSYHLFIVFLCCLHRSEQYFTSSQTFSHFLRQEKGRPQTKQIFCGRSDFLITSDLI